MTRSESGRLGAIAGWKKWSHDRAKLCRESYESSPKKCKYCEIILPYEKRRHTFCNSSCAASFNNTGCRRHPGPKPVLGNCLNCGKQVHDIRCKFCTGKCEEIYKWKQTKKHFVEIGKIEVGRSGNPIRAKKYLKEVRGIKCEICGLTEWLGKEVPLVLDHIDGNSMNWNLTNLRLICGNCNMQTPTFCRKNKKGNGRKYRILEYHKNLLVPSVAQLSRAGVL
jgi:hypothetical protein